MVALASGSRLPRAAHALVMKIMLSQTRLAAARRVETAVVAAATVASVVLLGTVLAYWTWQLLSPRATPVARVVETPHAHAARSLFGAPRAAAAVPLSANLRLVGVAATAGPRDGYALVHDGTRTRLLRAGDTIGPDARVSEVHASHVVLERGGARIVLGWPATTNAALHAAHPAPR